MKTNKIIPILLFIILFSFSTQALILEKNTYLTPSESNTTYVTGAQFNISDLTVNSTHIGLDYRQIEFESNNNILANITKIQNSSSYYQIFFKFNKTGTYTFNHNSSKNATLFVNNVEVGQTFNLTSTSHVIRYNEPTNNYVYFYDAKNSSPLVNNSITITYPVTGTEIDLTTDSYGKVYFNSYYEDQLQLGNYTIKHNGIQGYLSPITFYYNSTTPPFNISYNLTRANLTINIYDRATGNLFTNNASIVIEGLLNGSTSNGTYFIEDLTMLDQDYTIVVKSNGYFTEQKVVSFTNREALEVSFYLLNESRSTSATLTVRTITEFQKLIKDVTVYLQEYNEVSKSYELVSECNSNLNGECRFLIQLNEKKYIISAFKNDSGNIISGTMEEGEIFVPDIASGEEVVFSEIIRSIVLVSTDGGTLSPVYNIVYEIDADFNNVTNESTIRVDFRTLDGGDSTLCIEYFSVLNGAKTSITGEKYCLTSSSGVLTPNQAFVLNRSKNYIAELQYIDGSDKVILESIRINSINSLEGLFASEGIIPYIILFVEILLLSLGLLSKNIPLFGFVYIVITWLFVLFFPSEVLISIASFKTIISIFIIYQARKKEDLL